MSANVLEMQFESQRHGLPGSVEQRRAALDAFLGHGFPTRRDEAWKYTDLKPIASGRFAPAPPPAADSGRKAVETALAEAVPEAGAGRRVVFVDGRLDRALSRLHGGGLEIAALGADGDRLTSPGRAGRLDAHPLAQLNRAFARDGVAVRVAAGSAIDSPLEIFLAGGAAHELAQHVRLSIELGPNASLAIVVHCLDSGASPNWLNLVLDVVQAEGSRLSLHRLQEHGAEVFHTSLLAAELAKDSCLQVGYVDLGARLARNDIDLRLAEPGASADVFGIFLASSGQHIDEHIRIDHAAEHTTSATAFRGIAGRNGRGVFNGKVIVRPGAQRIDARQSSDNLLLADQAEIDTKPELEIYADDVKCSHGATVGELDAEQLFYLRSRGLPEDAARGLLTFAFANALLRRIEPERLRERAARKVAGQLPDHGWEDLG
ncbi:MAG TPA: Fe-S cluster assembly protein SufD [Gammaproteobacteria bacterium]